jgi:hypothetical protein
MLHYFVVLDSVCRPTVINWCSVFYEEIGIILISLTSVQKVRTMSLELKVPFSYGHLTWTIQKVHKMSVQRKIWEHYADVSLKLARTVHNSHLFNDIGW